MSEAVLIIESLEQALQEARKIEERLRANLLFVSLICNELDQNLCRWRSTMTDNPPEKCASR